MKTQAKRETADFTNQNIYVGFDVHLKSWKVTFISALVVKCFNKLLAEM